MAYPLYARAPTCVLIFTGRANGEHQFIFQVLIYVTYSGMLVLSSF
jgi:hypothetical protein